LSRVRIVSSVFETVVVNVESVLGRVSERVRREERVPAFSGGVSEVLAGRNRKARETA
jgi:hypothetical protein